MTTYMYTIIAPPGSISSVGHEYQRLGTNCRSVYQQQRRWARLRLQQRRLHDSCSARQHWSQCSRYQQLRADNRVVRRPKAIGFLDTDGVFTTIDPPGSFNTHPLSVNDAGQVVGYYFDSIGEHGFLYSGGTYTTLDQPSGIGYFTVAYDINNSGQIVGYGFGQGPTLQGFLYSGGVYTIIDPPGSFDTYASQSTTRDRSLGTIQTVVTTIMGSLDSGGTYTTLDFPGAYNTYLDHINDSGQIVGRYREQRRLTLQGTASFIAMAPSR